MKDRELLTFTMKCDVFPSFDSAIIYCLLQVYFDLRYISFKSMILKSEKNLKELGAWRYFNLKTSKKKKRSVGIFTNVTLARNLISRLFQDDSLSTPNHDRKVVAATRFLTDDQLMVQITTSTSVKAKAILKALRSKILHMERNRIKLFLR